ncbi:MAG: ABC transporter substrate-binding protein [Phycisphaerae bacterium]
MSVLLEHGQSATSSLFFRRLFLGFCAATVAVLCSVSFSVARSDDAGVQVVVLFRTQTNHRRAALAIGSEFQSQNIRYVLLELPERGDKAAQDDILRRLIDFNPTIVATGGTKATMLVLDALPTTPVVFFLVPNALDAPFMMEESPLSGRVAGVTTDIDPDAQLAWLARFSPRARRIGVLTSWRSQRTASALAEAGPSHAMEVTPIEAHKDSFISAIDAINARRCDAVMMIPDAQVYNSATVQRLLLWGLRQKKPVSAFSARVTKAGALTGQYCNDEAIGRQVARLIRRVMRGADIASIGLEYPDQIDHAVNERTADLIGVPLDEELLQACNVRFGGKE